MSVMQSVKADSKKIAGDVVTVGGSVGALIAILVNVAPAVHLPAAATAALVAASSIVASVVAEARRIQRAKKLAKASK